MENKTREQDRLEKLEDKIGDIREDQSAIKENLSIMGKTIGTLADIRAETLHIMKQMSQIQKDHDEIFTRLRTAESGRAACDERNTDTRSRIGKLETNQRWGVLLIIAAVLSYVFKKVFIL